MAVCATPGCHRITPNGYCSECRKVIGAERRRTEDRRYQTQRWREYSKARLAAHPFCVDCNRLAEVTDHILPVFAFPDQFFDERNHASRCQSCNRKKAIADRQRYAGCEGTGRPDSSDEKAYVVS